MTDQPGASNRSLKLVPLLISLLVACCIAAVWLSPILRWIRTGRFLEVTLDVARALETHWWAPLAYLLAYALLDIALIPTQALSCAAVVIWGWKAGGSIELVSATLGAVTPFLLTRSAGGGWARGRLERHASAASLLRKEGPAMVLVLRFVPVIPYTLLNYLAGLTPVSLSMYVATTAVGIAPSTFIFAYFVQALLDGAIRPREVLLRGLLAGSLLALSVVLTRLAASRISQRIGQG